VNRQKECVTNGVTVGTFVVTTGHETAPIRPTPEVANA
jgi:hypothetical protein